MIVDHYEPRGRSSLLFLAQDGSSRCRPDHHGGRALHRAWVAEMFAPLLPGKAGERDVRGPARGGDRRLHLEAAAKDRGLTRAQAQQRIERLVRAVLTDLGEPGRTHD